MKATNGRKDEEKMSEMRDCEMYEKLRKKKTFLA